MSPTTENHSHDAPSTTDEAEVIQLDGLEFFSRSWETYNELYPVITERKIVFQCRICIQMSLHLMRNPYSRKKFTSIIAFTKHIYNHEKKCGKCRQVFKTWKELRDHEPFCPRRFGRFHRGRYPPGTRAFIHPPPTPYKCQFCKRKYETKDHLLNHQINRCAVRLRTHWVVKL